MKFHELKVQRVRHDALDALVITFEVPAQLRERFVFAAGQYLTLRVQAEGGELRRPYSICSAVHEEALSVAVRCLPEGRFSSWARRELREGIFVDVMEPAGTFAVRLDPSQARRYLGVAGGSGITPVLSILTSVLAHEKESEFTLIYVNRAPESAMFLSELRDQVARSDGRLKLHSIYSRFPSDGGAATAAPSTSRKQLRELVEAAQREAGFNEAFVCGPEGLIELTCDALRSAGMEDHAIRCERFSVSTTPNAPDGKQSAVESRVQATIGGIDFQFTSLPTDTSLVDGAARSGCDLPISCGAGVCSTCRAKVVRGKVQMTTNFALSDEQVEQGFVLTCQSRPLTPELALDFDAT